MTHWDRRHRHLPHSIYRIFDASGSLLYIGMARDVDTRIDMHLNPTSTAWCADEVRARYAYHTSQAYADWDEAHAAEVAAIGAETPELNVQHNRTKWRWDGRARAWVRVDLEAVAA